MIISSSNLPCRRLCFANPAFPHVVTYSSVIYPYLGYRCAQCLLLLAPTTLASHQSVHTILFLRTLNRWVCILQKIMNLNNQQALYKYGMTPVFRLSGNPNWARLKQKVVFEVRLSWLGSDLLIDEKRLPANDGQLLSLLLDQYYLLVGCTRTTLPIQ